MTGVKAKKTSFWVAYCAPEKWGCGDVLKTPGPWKADFVQPCTRFLITNAQRGWLACTSDLNSVSIKLLICILQIKMFVDSGDRAV